MDPDKLLPEDRQRMQQLTGLQFPMGQPGAGPQAQLPAPEAENLNGAGDKSGGRDLALPMYPRRGNV